MYLFCPVSQGSDPFSIFILLCLNAKTKRTKQKKKIIQFKKPVHAPFNGEEALCHKNRKVFQWWRKS